MIVFFTKGFIFMIIFCRLHIYDNKKIINRKVFADVSTLRLSREHDGTLGLWSFYGNASESHAVKTQFLYNGDLLHHDSISKFSINTSFHHINIASTVYPLSGITSDYDPFYQKYLILQSKVAGIDGFLIEWGYKGHISDKFLQDIIRLVKDFKFSLNTFYVGVNWCDAWLKEKLKNASFPELIKAYHENAQYLLDTVFTDPSAIIHDGHPVIFLFDGSLTSKNFYDFLQIPFKLPKALKSPLWIGNYLNFAFTPEQRHNWQPLINGTFGWNPHNYARSPPLCCPEWDIFTTPKDTVIYQENITELVRPLIYNGSWVFWASSANPGFDNRGCAAWGRALEYTPREWDKRNTYEEQWLYHIYANTSSNIIIIPTLNDYAEATVILPTLQFGFKELYITEKFNRYWKEEDSQPDGILLAFQWFQIIKVLEFLDGIQGVDVYDYFRYMRAVELLLDENHFPNVRNFLNYVRNGIHMIEKQISVMKKVIKIGQSGLYPIFPFVTLNGSYLINSTIGLYFQLNEVKALSLRNNQFKGLLQFEYKQLSDGVSALKILSSCQRNLSERLFADSYESHYNKVCNLKSVTQRWQKATVELFKKNQAWNHNGPHDSDIYFKTNDAFLVKSITMTFKLYNLK